MAVTCLFIRGISGAWLELCDPLELTRGHWQVRLAGLSPTWRQSSSPFTPGLDLMCLQAPIFTSSWISFKTIKTKLQCFSNTIIIFVFMSLNMFCNRLKWHCLWNCVDKINCHRASVNAEVVHNSHRVFLKTLLWFDPCQGGAKVSKKIIAFNSLNPTASVQPWK